jgi:hypothetical protein
MSNKYFYSAGAILLFALVACTFKQKEEPLDEKLLPGKYCHSHDRRDSIFVYPDKTYKHTYHRSDGVLKSQEGTWYFKHDINDLFFDDFTFFNDGTPPYVTGTWPPHVFVTKEGQVKLQYSESVYYVRAQEK